MVVVGDIDCLYSAFFNLRARGGDPDDEVDFHFDNVPFVLNVLDTLAGDDRFVEIRTRRPAHRVLTRVNEATEKSRDVANHQREAFSKKYEQEVANARKNFQQKLDEVEKETGGNSQQQSIQMLMARENAQRLLDTKLSGLKRDRDEQIKVTEAALAREVNNVQDTRKLWAVVLPPIPPLIVAFIVFFNRRAREREGVSKARLR